MTKIATGLAEKVRGLADDLGLIPSDQADGSRVQFWVPSWCHSEDAKTSLSVGTHDPQGNESADGFPLVFCHVGCGYATIRAALVRRGARAELLRPATGSTGPAGRSTGQRPAASPAPAASVPVVPNEVWVEWHDRLLTRPDQLAYLQDEKGLTEDTVRAMCLGWDGKRITIPVFDEDGLCVNVRRYLPHAGPGADKVINYWQAGGPSYGRNRLYSPSEHLAPDRRTLLCAGELDAILGWQHGWQTATLTGGESSRFPPMDLERMRGQKVVIAYDNDDAGRAGAEKTATALAAVAASVAVADLSNLDLPDKGDLGDVWRRDDLGGAAVREVVAAATSWGTRDGEGNSWLPVDLTDVLDGTYEPLQPTVCRRGEGQALFYPGKSHELIADSEAGKTWLALYAAKQEVEAGHHVFFYDFEDDVGGVVGRLQVMDTHPALLREHFHYVRPDQPLTDDIRAAWLAEHDRFQPSLVVLDGVTEVMSQHKLGQSDNDDIAVFYRTILRPMADLGAAVVALDHLPKYDEKGRGAIGGVHKINGIDGAVYRLKPIKEIAPGRTGITSVTIDKDRPGQVRRQQADHKRIADLIVDAEGGDDEPVVVMLEAPGTIVGPPPTDKPPASRPLDAVSVAILAALANGAELTPGQITTALAEGGSRVSESTVKRRLGDLDLWGRASVREEVNGGKKTGYWSLQEANSGAET